MITYEIERDYYLLAKACSEQEKGLLDRTYYEIDKDSQKYGLVDGAEAVLSANTYHLISEMVGLPSETIVVDCGCHIGLQQVFFSHFKKYIGIDRSNHFFKICDNAEFIQGDILEVLPDLELKGRNVGISVLCGSVWKDVGDVIKNKFEHIIMI